MVGPTVVLQNGQCGTGDHLFNTRFLGLNTIIPTLLL